MWVLGDTEETQEKETKDGVKEGVVEEKKCPD